MISSLKGLASQLGSIFPDVEYAGDTAIVHTHCLYPDGQGVSVIVHHDGASMWKVTDAGGGWGVLRDHFLSPSPRSAARRADAIAKSMGVSYHEGEWEAPRVTNEQLIGSVLLVANAAQAWVTKMMASEHHGRSEIIEEKLEASLRSAFGEKNLIKAPSIGGLNKVHELSVLVSFPGQRSAAFEVVTPYAGSIYPAYTKMSDISHNEDHPDYLGVVVESIELWRADDLALLRSAGTEVIDIDKGLPAKLIGLAA